MRAERNETNARIMKMEDEIQSLRSVLTQALSNTARQNVGYQMNSTFNEREFSRSSGRSADRPKRHSMSLNYGTINNENPMIPHQSDILTPMNQPSHESRKPDKGNYLGYSDNVHLNGHVNGIYTTPENEHSNSDIMQMEQETLKLRKELQDVLDSKQLSDSKIIA